MKKREKVWHVWVDTGGTFTDCIALAPDGTMRRAKILSSSAIRGVVRSVNRPDQLEAAVAYELPDGFFDGAMLRFLSDVNRKYPILSYSKSDSTIKLSESLPKNVQSDGAFEILCSEEAPVLAARIVTSTPIDSPLPPLEMRLATTRGTNALLERKGAPTALFITEGFADLLEIGTQARPELFALEIIKPRPLYCEVVEVKERVAFDGSVLGPLDLRSIEDAASELTKKNVRSAAVALMHGYVNPSHEKKIRDFLYSKGFEHVSISSEIAPLIKLLVRAETTVVNAYLSPVIGEYLENVSASLCEGGLRVMTSAGGLVGMNAFKPKDSLLSGPAGGVVGAVESARASGCEKIITFDMGGTSTDVARYDGDYEYVFEHRIADANLVAPALGVESVAAGGGSICRFDGLHLKVGPESSGAFPGPACYGAGGPLSITDVNLLLGLLEPSRFEIPIDVQAARKAFGELIGEISASTGEQLKSETVLTGLRQIADEIMADAIKRISVSRGYDPADYALVAFGGAGAQHACSVSELLGIRKILVPPDVGLLSAYGLGCAAIERFAEKQVLKPVVEIENAIDGIIGELSQKALGLLETEGVPREDSIVRRRIVNMRFSGQDSSISIELESGKPLSVSFRARYAQLYGYEPEEGGIEIESIRVVASSKPAEKKSPSPPKEFYKASPEGTHKAFIKDRWADVPVYHRERLKSGAALSGPALIFERHSSVVVEPLWNAHIDGCGAIVLERPPDE
jgi:5-oxoprolinase (ATP-hydrolysing)